MRKILAIFMLFAGLNLAAGEKMQNLKIILKSPNGEATAILDDTAAARSFAAQLTKRSLSCQNRLIQEALRAAETAKKARSPTLLRGITLSSTTATSPIMKVSCA